MVTIFNGGFMHNLKNIKNDDDALELLTIALEHEWAVSFEYVIHAYSMPKAKFFYDDPIMKIRKDMRAQTIQIGIDEMYHALQLGIVLRQMGADPSFKTDEVIRYPRVIDNLRRDKKTEDLVTDLYQSAEIPEGLFPKIQNMVLNIAYDEIRHAAQFQAMIDTMEKEGGSDTLCYQHDPKNAGREDIQLLHEVMQAENELMHRYLKYTILFSEHQDLSQRLFKNSIDHMKHWDKNSGILIKLGDVVKIENAEKDADGVETSLKPMPALYPGEDRQNALQTLVPAEEDLIAKYERLLPLIADGDIKNQLHIHLSLKREHLFTQQHLLENALKIQGLE
jgi:bacterioferritin (cytochrome b1)